MGEPLLEAHNELKSVLFHRKFSKFNQVDMIGSQKTHFDVGHHMHFHALLKDFPARVFQVASPNFGAIHESRKH